MRTGNPALNANVFTQAPRVIGSEAMTITGTVNRSAILLAVLLMGAAWTWNMALSGENTMLYTLIGGIGGFIVAMVTIFKKEWAPMTAPAYAALEGLLLGGLSAHFETMLPGIVMQAVGLTFGTLFALLAAYRSGLIKVTENFKLGIVAATGGIALVYLATFVLGFFGIQIPMIHENGLIGIAFSGFVVVIAALNLVLDFDFIENGAEQNAPKYMEWYAAFGLMVTLVWLYIEILHLLYKLQSRR